MQKSPFLSLLLLLAIGAKSFAQSQSAQAIRAHHIGGRCHDFSTALGLKASVFAISKQGRTKLVTCKDDGNFNVLVPESATHMSLELAGYRTVSIPIHFTPNIPPEAWFGIWNLGMMTPVDSTTPLIPTYMKNLVSFYFQTNDSSYVGSVNYKLTNLTTSKEGGLLGISTKQLGPIGPTFPVEPGTYLATLTTRDGRVISSEKFTTKPGITFKSVRVGKPLSVSAVSNVPDKTPARSTATLYFDQSSPDLRPSVKTTLDSVARLLVSQPDLLATITGYTDNVGRHDLNLSLSEYRARAVATYLSQRGVPASQLLTNWQGPDAATSATDAEAVKIRSRRVVIAIMPK